MQARRWEKREEDFVTFYLFCVLVDGGSLLSQEDFFLLQSLSYIFAGAEGKRLDKHVQTCTDRERKVRGHRVEFSLDAEDREKTKRKKKKSVPRVVSSLAHEEVFSLSVCLGMELCSYGYGCVCPSVFVIPWEEREVGVSIHLTSFL